MTAVNFQNISRRIIWDPKNIMLNVLTHGTRTHLFLWQIFYCPMCKVWQDFKVRSNAKIESSYSQLWDVFSRQKNIRWHVPLNRSYDSNKEKARDVPSRKSDGNLFATLGRWRALTSVSLLFGQRLTHQRPRIFNWVLHTMSPGQSALLIGATGAVGEYQFS